jgi:hypothetical protein
MKFLYSIKAMALTIGLMLAVTFVNGATYYSQSSSAPHTLANWNTVRAGGGATPANFTTAGNTFTIQSGHTMTTTAVWTVSGTGSGVVIESGGTLVASYTVSLGTFNVNSGGTYQHNYNSTTIPTATWGATSTCYITGITTSVPTLSQAFGNFTWNSANTQDITLTSKAIAGNLTILNAANGAQFRIRAASNTCTVAGNYSQSGANTAVFLASGTSRTLTVAGSFSLTAGTLALSSGSGIGTLNVAGSFTHSAGTITETSSGSGNVNFNGTGSEQTYTSGSGTLIGLINFTVNTGAFLQMAAEATVVNGSAFTLSSGATLGIKSNVGITTSGATGNIQSTARTYNAAANYTYNGSAAQVTGNGLTTANNLTINNSAGVKASGNLTVNGVLNLQSANPTTTKGALEMTTSYTTPGGTYPGTLNTDYLDSKTLNMGATATTTGTGDVTGTVNRATILANTPYTFGHQYTTVALSTGTMPTSLAVSITIGTTPAGNPDAIKRTYEIVPTVPSGYTSASHVTANFHYLDNELTSSISPNHLNVEATMVTMDYDIDGGFGTPDEHGRSVYDFDKNFIGLANIPIDYFITVNGSHTWRTLFQLRDFINDYYTWTGTTSKDWGVSTNWTGNGSPTGVPSDLSHVIIPNTAIDPELPSGTTTINTLTIENGGVLTMGSNTLIIQNKLSGGWDDQNANGNDPGTSKVIFSRPGTTVSGNARFYDVEISDGADISIQTGGKMIIGNSVTRTGTVTGKWYADVFDGTVEYSGGTQAVVLPDGTPNYHNLILSGTGTKTLPASAMTIHGNFTLSGSASASAGGDLTIGRSVTLGSGTTFTAGSHAHSVGVNFMNNGAAATFTGSTFTFNGDTIQTIGGTSSTIFNHLTASNASGITLGANETVSGTLTLTNGIITTGSNTLTASGTISGATTASYINGKLAQVYSTTGSKAFPIGKGGNYRPVTLNYTALTGTSTVTAEQFETALPGTLPANTSLLGNRYWSISEAGGSGYTYNLTLDATGFTPKRSDAVLMLKSDGSSATSHATTTTPPNYTNSTGLTTSLGSFGLGEVDLLTWDGSTSTDWTVYTNWTPEIVPIGVDNVLIPSGPTNQPAVTSSPASPALCNQLTIAGTLTINAGKALTVNGTLTNNGTINILSTASGTGSLIQHTAGVTGNVQRYIAGWTGATNIALHGWHFLSSPVDMQAISTFHDANSGNDFYKWDEITNYWINRKVAGFETEFAVGTGYLIANATTTIPTFTGTLNVDDVNISGLTMSGSQTYTGWHLIGNPFSSALSWNNGDWNLVNIAANCEIWDETSASYTPALITPGNAIPAMNGFMVHADAAGASLTIPASARVHSSQAWYKSAEQNSDMIVLIARDPVGKTAQRSVIRFAADATEGYDTQYDNYFLSGFAPLFYSVSQDAKYILNTLPVLDATTTIPLGFVKNANSQFTIELSQNIPGLSVYLTDKKTNLTQKLNDGGYTFISLSGDNADRFLLNFLDVTSVADPKQAKDFSIYVSDGILNMQSFQQLGGKIMVTDMMGRTIATGRIEAGATTQLNINRNTGVYIVSVLTAKGRSNTKIIVK